MTRLVLLDRKNCIRGDTATLASRSFAWVYARARGNDDVADLATVAARIFDAKSGQIGHGYSFSTFAAKDDADGYYIFECDCAAERAPPALAAGAGPEATAAVMTACFYVGYVHRDH